MICSMLLENVDQVQQNWFKINQLQTIKILLYLPPKNLFRLFHMNEMKLKRHLHQKITIFCFLHPSPPQYALLTNSGQIQCQCISALKMLNLMIHSIILMVMIVSSCGGRIWRSPKALCHFIFFWWSEKQLLSRVPLFPLSWPPKQKDIPPFYPSYIQGRFTPNVHRHRFQSCLLTWIAPSLACNDKNCLSKMVIRKQLIRYFRRINMLLV